MEPSSFSALLDQLREGDTAAVEQFVAEYERAIRRELGFCCWIHACDKLSAKAIFVSP